MFKRVRLFAAFVFTLASVYGGRASFASEDRVAVLDASPNLSKAISAALSPWGLRVVPLNATISSRDVATAAEEARLLADSEHLGAIIWFATATGQRPSLWLYDSQSEQVTVRPLSQPRPYDDAAAAAIALSVKTLLRATAMAPVPERSAAPSPTSSGSSSVPPATPSIAATASASSSPTSPPRSPVAPMRSANVAPRSVNAPPVWRIEAVVLGRTPTGTNPALALEGALGGSFWPSIWKGRLGVGLSLVAGPSLDIAGPLFAGTFSDSSVAATARARVERQHFAIELELGPALHITSLAGTSLSTTRSASVQRGDVALRGVIVPELVLSRRVAVGLPLGLATFLRTQRYEIGNDLVLRTPLLTFDFGGRVSFALD